MGGVVGRTNGLIIGGLVLIGEHQHKLGTFHSLRFYTHGQKSILNSMTILQSGSYVAVMQAIYQAMP